MFVINIHGVSVGKVESDGNAATLAFLLTTYNVVICTLVKFRVDTIPSKPGFTADYRLQQSSMPLLEIVSDESLQLYWLTPIIGCLNGDLSLFYFVPHVNDWICLASVYGTQLECIDAISCFQFTTKHLSLCHRSYMPERQERLLPRAPTKGKNKTRSNQIKPNGKR